MTTEAIRIHGLGFKALHLGEQAESTLVDLLSLTDADKAYSNFLIKRQL